VFGGFGVSHLTGSSSGEPFRSLKILLHRFKAIVQWDLPARKEKLKIQLWQLREKRRLAQSQPLPLEQRHRKLGTQLSLSQSC
jgi:hypothetical protein